ncbi:MAG: DNA recombination protein RmuC, partial [Oscillospiraceae bacterium]|nr:DNA recombination protein RmuC [Oscillospiraceae bacterium]
TLAIQKRSGEVWKVLGAVRTEFDRFGEVLEATQKRLEQTSAELDKLVGVRTRQIKNKLREVTSLPQAEAEALFGPEEEDGEN